MIVYQTDFDGYYIGTTQADESPLEPGIFHIPAGAYGDAPAIPQGHYARRSSGSWHYYPIPEPEPSPVEEALVEPTPLTPEQELLEWRRDMVVSRFQARAALHNIDKLTAAEAVVAQADMLTKLAWADAIEFKRLSPSILILAPSLGLDQEALDDLFTAAKLIVA
jgi:hypothetical protein